jgi:hypothetical protein
MSRRLGIDPRLIAAEFSVENEPPLIEKIVTQPGRPREKCAMADCVSGIRDPKVPMTTIAQLRRDGMFTVRERYVCRAISSGNNARGGARDDASRMVVSSRPLAAAPES